MATCPKCLGPLTDDHKCSPRGVFIRVLDALVTLVVGALMGWMTVLVFDDHAAGALILAAAALGAVLATAVRQAVSGPLR